MFLCRAARVIEKVRKLSRKDLLPLTDGDVATCEDQSMPFSCFLLFSVYLTFSLSAKLSSHFNPFFTRNRDQANSRWTWLELLPRVAYPMRVSSYLRMTFQSSKNVRGGDSIGGEAEAEIGDVFCHGGFLHRRRP